MTTLSSPLETVAFLLRLLCTLTVDYCVSLHVSRDAGGAADSSNDRPPSPGETIAFLLGSDSMWNTHTLTSRLSATSVGLSCVWHVSETERMVDWVPPPPETAPFGLYRLLSPPERIYPNRLIPRRRLQSKRCPFSSALNTVTLFVTLSRGASLDSGALATLGVRSGGALDFPPALVVGDAGRELDFGLGTHLVAALDSLDTEADVE